MRKFYFFPTKVDISLWEPPQGQSVGCCHFPKMSIIQSVEWWGHNGCSCHCDRQSFHLTSNGKGYINSLFMTAKHTFSCHGILRSMMEKLRISSKRLWSRIWTTRKHNLHLIVFPFFKLKYSTNGKNKFWYVDITYLPKSNYWVARNFQQNAIWSNIVEINFFA